MKMNENNIFDEMEDEIRELHVTAKVSKEEKADLLNACDDKRVIKYLVDQYNQSQQYRIRSQNQARALLQGVDESNEQQYTFIQKEIDNASAQEALNKKYMDIVTDGIPVCRWMKSITGIGPCISAYLYAAFDVKVGTYNTNFLSYAGLNDNNNPWLGTAKANELTNKAIEYRSEKYDKITNIIKSYCKDEKQFDKLVKALPKKDFEISGVVNTINKITGVIILKDPDIDLGLICDWCMWMKNPKICDDILIQYVSITTGRNFINVKKGVENNWSKKANKTAKPTTDDLASYLAKPPYNTELKKRMFIISDMFVRNSNREKSLYGKIYKQKKLEFMQKNDKGFYAEQAKRILESKNFSKDTNAYKALIEGRLPDAQINMRARRYAVKLFISHVFEAMYYAEFHEEPPKTYVIQFMGHHDYIAPEVDYRPYIDGEL